MCLVFSALDCFSGAVSTASITKRVIRIPLRPPTTNKERPFPRLSRLLDAAGALRREVVEHHHVAASQGRAEYPLGVGVEDFGVYRALNRQRRDQPAQAHRVDHGGVRAIVARR